MARTLEQIVADAKAHAYDERLKNVQGSIRFDIEGTGTYRVEVDRGRLSVREEGGPADTVVACDPDDFTWMMDGHRNLLTAYMQGRVRIEGDLALAKVLHGILPSYRPEASAEGVPS